MAGGRITASATPADSTDVVLASKPSFALKASARNITRVRNDDPDASGVEPIEHREAWAAFESIPEVTNLVEGSANLLSQARFGPGVTVIDPEGGNEIDLTLDQARALPQFAFVTDQFIADSLDVFARYTDEAGSQAGLIRPMAECWSVVGACKIAGWNIDDNGDPVAQGASPSSVAGERWVATAPGSIFREGTSIATDAPWSVKLSARRPPTVIPDMTVRKVWWNHPRYPDDSLGWVLAALDVCRDLRAFTLGQRSSARSGIPADLFIVPTEASPKKPTAAGHGPGEEGAIEQAVTSAEEWAADVEGLIGEFILGVLEDYDAGNSAVPGVLAVEGRFIEFFQKMSFSRPVDRGLGELTNQARQRLAQSADCPPDMLFGLGQTNRWNGAQIADDEYRRYFRPKATALANAWTTALYWPDMIERGYRIEDLRRVRTVVDASAVVAQPDFSKLGPQLIDRLVVGHSGLRRMLRIPEWAAPTDAEVELALELKGAKKDQGASSGTGKGDQGPPSGKPDTPDKSKGAVIPARLAPQPQLAAVSAGDLLAADLIAIEREAQVRLEEACEATLDKLIERAGSQLRNWSRKAGGDLRALAAATPANAELVRLVGPDRARQLATDNDSRAEDVFLVALAALLVAFGRIAHDAYAAALARLGAALPQEQIDAAIVQAENVLRDSMMQLAEREVFGPIITEADIGELTNLRIPGPVLRRVLAVAGGALGVGPGLDPSVDAALGLAFGPLLASVSPPSDGLRWVYGTELRRRPFEPHEALDGLVVSDTQDDKLAGSIFAGTAWWYPGDHNGCRCRWALSFTTD